MKGLEAFEKHLKHFEAFFNHAKPSSRVVRRFLPKHQTFVVSPHPDDEILSGGLALRLQKENQSTVKNIAVTLGSDSSRKLPRRQELKRALKFLRWDGQVLPDSWAQKEKKLVDLLKKERPALIIAPHIHDHHPTHVKTAQLVQRAVLKARLTTTIAWAEYWNPQANPNLLIEISRELLVQQIRALAFHKGEVARNPYHLLLPAWQTDSVRRGSEWLGGKGAVGASFVFGQLYRVEKWKDGKRSRKPTAPLILSAAADLSDLLN